MKRFLMLAIGLALAVPAWATWYSGQNLAVNDTSAQITFSSAQCAGGICASVSFYNSGSNAAYVKVFDNCATVAAIATGDPGVVLIPAGLGYEASHDKRTECGGGYKGFSRIGPGGGLTTTLNVVGK